MQENYQKQLIKYAGFLEEANQRSGWFSAGRLLSLLAVVAGIYIFFSLGNIYGIWAAILFLTFFLVLIVRHTNLKKQKQRYNRLISLNQKEVKFLEGEVVDWENGERFRDAQHLYSSDLDIFGSHSLFYHINRAATRSGEERLAQTLSAPGPSQSIGPRQEAIKELVPLLDWRQNFIAAGLEEEEDPQLQNKLKLWLKGSKPSAARVLLHPATRFILAIIAIGLGLHFVFYPNPQHFEWWMYGMGLNIALVFSQFRHIKKEYNQLNGITRSLRIYAELIASVERQAFGAAYLQNIAGQLSTRGQTASKALYRLGRILDGFDQMNNVVALILTNGLYLYHLHVLNELYRWKKEHGGQIIQWLSAVTEMDELVSLSNYAANNPDFTYPEVADAPKLEAEGIAHPLIAPQKRVANSLSTDGYKYMILTGSNMSGKSTFLKTIGINLVLMRAGAPVCSLRFKSYPFTLLTSMKLVDSLEREESYFQAEVLRLKRIKQELEGEAVKMVLLDEILRGTNSDDKRNGTRLFMQKIGSFEARGIIATHDIDIADLAKQEPGIFKDYYFESQVKDGELTFDYLLREGICTTPNATELMRSHGVI